MTKANERRARDNDAVNRDYAQLGLRRPPAGLRTTDFSRASVRRYVPGTTYHPGNLVQYLGRVYLATDHTIGVPGRSGFWRVVAAR